MAAGTDIRQDTDLPYGCSMKWRDVLLSSTVVMDSGQPGAVPPARHLVGAAPLRLRAWFRRPL